MRLGHAWVRKFFWGYFGTLALWHFEAVWGKIQTKAGNVDYDFIGGGGVVEELQRERESTRDYVTAYSHTRMQSWDEKRGRNRQLRSKFSRFNASLSHFVRAHRFSR